MKEKIHTITPVHHPCPEINAVVRPLHKDMSTAPAIPMTSRLGPLCPSPRLSISSLMATADSPAPPLRITAARFGQAELHRQSDRGRWQQRHHSPRPGDCRQRKRGRVCQHGRRVGDFRLHEEAAHRVGGFRAGRRRSDSGSDWS